MALSIKNARAEKLAKELAKESGTTVTASVIVALEEALRRVVGRKNGPSAFDAILEVSERCAALPELDSRSAEEILGYDKDGGFS